LCPTVSCYLLFVPLLFLILPRPPISTLFPYTTLFRSPTFKFAGKIPGITEIRPGNAVFYDMVQVGLGIATKQQCALTVKATVASDRKSTRLNSSHVSISYAVFCLKKKNNKRTQTTTAE